MVNKITTPPTQNEVIDKINELVDDKQDKITSSNKLSASLVSGLATVATSGSYNDLSNKPTIPTVDQTYSATSANAQSGLAISGAKFLQNTATNTESLTIYGDASNRRNTINIGAHSSPTGVNSVMIGAYSKAGEGAFAIGNGATAGNYSLGLLGSATANYAYQIGRGTNTETNSLYVGWVSSDNYKLLGSDGLIPDARISQNIARTSDLSTVATTGSYNDLNNKPTIPTVNNATLTIQKNGSNVATFTANASSNVTANITVPTTTSSVTSGSTAALTSGGAYTNLVRRKSTSSATGGTSQGVYVDANGKVQTCDAVTSTYAATGTAPVNGTAVASAISSKQDTLVSGTNIKTVGGTSLLGSGNVAFPTVDQTYSATSTNAQSGVAVSNAIATKQDNLVSGTNIKTINGNSLLGNGNITIETSSTPNVDGETISYNSSDALQTIAVKNVRDNSTLPIWHGTEYQWNHGDPTTWYYWQTSVTALWVSGGALPYTTGSGGIQQYSIAGGGGRFVKVFGYSTDGKKIAYSTDGGETWLDASIPSGLGNSSYLYSVAYGNGRFVVIARKATNCLYSTDGGETWQIGNMPVYSDQWNGIAYGDGRFVAVGYNYSGCVYSTDGGETWSSVTLPTQDFWNIAYGNGRFVIIGSKNCLYSTDGGETWQTGNVPFYSSDITFDGERFIMINSDGKLGFSSDVINWTTGNNVFYNARNIEYGNGTLLITGYDTDKTLYSTDGGSSWTQSLLPSSGSWMNLAYDNGRFVATSNGSDVSAIFTVQYDKCYTDTANPTTTSVVYSEPETVSSYTISYVTSGAITLSNNNTYYYNQSGNAYTYQTIGDAHPEYLCFIDGVGVKMGNNWIATNNSNS